MDECHTFEKMSQFDPNNDLKINLGYSDLEFHDSSILSYSLKLFDGSVSYFWIISQPNG